MLGARHPAPLRGRQPRQPRRRLARARRRDENRRARVPEQASGSPPTSGSRPDSSSRTFLPASAAGPRWSRPGLAGLKTVMVLHDATRIGSPNATWGVIEGNPIQDDVREIARMTGVTFSVDVTLNRDQQITAVFAGELFAEHGQACAAAKGSVMRAVDAPVRRRPDDELRLPARSESVSGGQRHVGRREGGQAGRHDHLRGGVPRRAAEPRLVRRGARVAAVTAGAARDDQRAGLPRARCLAGADSGADPGEGEGAGEEQLHAAGADPRGALRADRRRRSERRRRAAAAGPGATLCVLPQGPQTIPYLR